MDYTVAIVRAFTEEGKKTIGNPADVLVTDEMLESDEMAGIAIQAKQPITSFLIPREGSKQDYDLRYYDLGGGNVIFAVMRPLQLQNIYWNNILNWMGVRLSFTSIPLSLTTKKNQFIHVSMVRKSR